MNTPLENGYYSYSTGTPFNAFKVNVVVTEDTISIHPMRIQALHRESKTII